MDTNASSHTLTARTHFASGKLSISFGETVLDAGCGLGHVAAHFTDCVGKDGCVVGIDSSEAMVAEAKKNYQFGNLKFRVENIYQIKNARNCYDAAYVGRVLHHLKRPENALKEVVRVLKPKGRIAVTEPDFCSSFIYPCDCGGSCELINCFSSSVSYGCMGRRLRQLFYDSGLVNICIKASTHTFESISAVNNIIPFDGYLNSLQENSDNKKFIMDIKEADRRGSFLFGWSLFTAYGVKPG